MHGTGARTPRHRRGTSRCCPGSRGAAGTSEPTSAFERPSTVDPSGSAWGLGRFDHLYQGAPLTEERDGIWGFYRYHMPDPVYFAKAIRVTLQQIAGGSVTQLRALPRELWPELVRNHQRFA